MQRLTKEEELNLLEKLLEGDIEARDKLAENYLILAKFLIKRIKHNDKQELFSVATFCILETLERIRTKQIKFEDKFLGAFISTVIKRTLKRFIEKNYTSQITIDFIKDEDEDVFVKKTYFQEILRLTEDKAICYNQGIENLIKEEIFSSNLFDELDKEIIQMLFDGYKEKEIIKKINIDKDLYKLRYYYILDTIRYFI